MLHAALILAGTFVSLVLLGLATGFSPTLIALQVAILARTGGVARRGLVVAAGVATGALVLTMILQVASPDAWESVFGGDVKSLFAQRAIDMVAGVLCVASGIWVLRNRHRQADHSSVRKASRLLDRPRSLYGFSAANTVVSVSGAASAYLVVRMAHEGSSDEILHLIVYAAFAFAASVPYLLLAWGSDRFPILSRTVDRTLGWLRSRSWRTIGGFTLIGVGVFFVVASATDYFGSG